MQSLEGHPVGVEGGQREMQKKFHFLEGKE
jgi:hypothetical protein